MKKTILLMLAGLIGVEFSAFADVERARKLTPLQKQQIAWAIKVLSDTKTLNANQNQCLQLDDDILNVLEADGKIERGGSQPDTICVGAASAVK